MPTISDLVGKSVFCPQCRGKFVMPTSPRPPHASAPSPPPASTERVRFAIATSIVFGGIVGILIAIGVLPFGVAIDPLGLRKAGHQVAESRPLQPDLANDFFSRFREGVEKVKSLATSAQRQDAERNLVDAMDKSLKSQRWTLRCPIKDVRERDGERFEISIDRPLEIPAGTAKVVWLPEGIGLLEPEIGKWMIGDPVYPPISRSQALAIRPGDLLVVSGTPRLTSTPMFYYDDCYGPHLFHFLLRERYDFGEPNYFLALTEADLSFSSHPK